MQLTDNEIEEKLKTLKTIYSYIKDESKTIHESMFAILDKEFHENTISDYLAYILDPKRNGIGSEPLNNVLKLFGTETAVTKDDYVDIQREYTLSNNRRIDFFITINDDHLIAMEHKVFSEEHGDQTTDYKREIEKEYRESGYSKTFIFLTPAGKEALCHSFKPISYLQLVNALKKVKLDFIKDIRKAVLFNEMIFHLEGYFLEKKNVALSQKSSLYIENHRMIHDLEEEFNKDYKIVFNHIKSIIMNYFENKLDGEWEFDFKESRSYQQIYKPHWKKGGLDIHFELRLAPHSLVSQKVTFMLDIEGKRKKQFENKCELRLKEKAANVFEKDKIKYRNSNRNDTFAHKEYSFLSQANLEDDAIIKQEIIQMIEDFSHFIGPIDEEIEYFNSRDAD